MYKIRYTGQFKRDYKVCVKRGLDMELLREVITILSRDGKLPRQYKPHKLTGNYVGFWECHIQADWLLIWQQIDDELVLIMTNTGTHSDLF